MNHDLKKTLIFAGIAALAVVVAWEPWKRISAAPEKTLEGEVLFPKLTDAKNARTLEVVKFEEADSTLRPFSIVYSDGTWKIPSHQDYPADAAENLAKAATSLMDLKILSVASTNPGDQELYGVLQPDGKLKVGAVGVGTRVTIKGEGDKKLADLIVGKEVKGKTDQRYVRKAGKDQIYVVALRTDKFSTKFGDWIEKDLLKLNAFDIRKLDLHEYSVQVGQTPQGRLGISQDPRSRIQLTYDDEKSKWNIDELVEYDKDGQPVQTELAENEEVNTEKLNALKTALDDLQIVDVERKPSGFSRDLKLTEEFSAGRNQQEQEEMLTSLMGRGFIPTKSSEGIEILSTEGEVLCGTKDGVEYVLRFGETAGNDNSSGDAKDEKTADKKDPQDADKKPADKNDEKSDKSAKVNRYLFVTARVNEDLITKPKLEPLPGDETAEPTEESAGDKPADADAGGADAAKGDVSEDDAEKTEKPAPDKKPATDKSPAAKKPVPEKKTAQTEGAEETPADAKADDGKAAASETSDGDKSADGEKPAETKAKDPAAEAKALAEKRASVEKENKRKQDEYDGKVKKAQEKVTELNTRFADWYYVISDDVYKKIHLGKADIVKEKPADKDAKKPDAGDAAAPAPTGDAADEQP
jgi:hypothetical protein